MFVVRFSVDRIERFNLEPQKDIGFFGLVDLGDDVVQPPSCYGDVLDRVVGGVVVVRIARRIVVDVGVLVFGVRIPPASC